MIFPVLWCESISGRFQTVGIQGPTATGLANLPVPDPGNCSIDIYRLGLAKFMPIG